MDQLFEVKQIDKRVYESELKDFLPERIIDVHTHVWLDRFKNRVEEKSARLVSWPSRVALDNSVEDLKETYRLMFPDKEVSPLMFSLIGEHDDERLLNDYVSEAAKKNSFPALIWALPRWSGEELYYRLKAGSFLGLKVYLDSAPWYIPRNEIRIFDYLPPHQLEIADRYGLIVMLHIPRDGRLKDPVNLYQMLEIEQRYPQVKLIIAHVGRAYCDEDVGNAFEILAEAKNMRFDFSANTNARVFEQLLRAVGHERVLFGSDLPILRMRMRRICEDGRYVNIVPKGLYGDVSGDKHMREVDEPEASGLTFFMYEELLAFKTAALRVGLSRRAIEDVFYNNAKRLIESVR